MNEQPNNWDWFNSNGDVGQALPAIDPDHLANISAKIFRSSDGRYLMRFLRSITMERSLGPNAAISQLRHLEGQRHLVTILINLIKRGTHPDA